VGHVNNSSNLLDATEKVREFPAIDTQVPNFRPFGRVIGAVMLESVLRAIGGVPGG
jgi:hypothetical protein